MPSTRASRRGVRARALADDADGRAEPVRVLEREQDRLLLRVEPGLLAGRDGSGGAAKRELDIAVRERLRLEARAAPDPGERLTALALAVAYPAGGRRQRLVRRGLPAAVAEGAAQDRRGLPGRLRPTRRGMRRGHRRD